MFYEYMMGMHTLWWVFWIAVVVAVVFWCRSGSRVHRDRPRETPHELLRRRLASGEIGAEEYEQRKRLLDRDSP